MLIHSCNGIIQNKGTQTFVQQCGSKWRNGKEYTYYYCNRHGNYRPKGSGKRAMKSQGTCKLGEPCTACMRAITCASSGKVSIEYCTNHNHEIAYLCIPQDTRVSIAAKLQDGVNVDKRERMCQLLLADVSSISKMSVTLNKETHIRFW